MSAEINGESKFSAVGRIALMASTLAPLVLVPHVFFPFVTTRNIYFRLFVELAFLLCLLARVRRLRDIEVKQDTILRWLFFYLCALGISAVAGLSPWHSVFGDFERMGGVLAWLHLFVFYCLLRILMRKQDWAVLFRIVILAADLSVLWGALEFLPQSIRNPMFSTTLAAGSVLGNPGLFAAYLLIAGVFAVWEIKCEESRFWKVFAAVSLGILLFGIGGSRNKSSELGAIVGVVLFCVIFLFLASDRRRIIRKLSLPAGISIIVLTVGMAFMTARAPEIADRLVGRWEQFFASPVDYSRTIEWQIALDGFRDRPIVGYGPENHEIVASHHFDPRIYDVTSDAIYDRTHNAWLELLATTGLIGAGTMLGIWLAAVGTIRRGVRERSLTAGESGIISAGLVAYATYLTFWFFDLNSAMLWVILLAFLSSRVEGRLQAFRVEEPGWRLRPFAWAIVGLTLLTAYLQGIVPLQTAHELSKAVEGGPFPGRLVSFEKVMNSSAPQTMHTFPLFSRFLRDASPAISRFGTSPLLRKEFELGLQRGLIEADRSVARNPSDDRSYVEAARFFSLAGMYYSDTRYFQRARTNLLKAIRISRLRPDTRLLLSGLELTLRDTTAAAAQLDSAMRLAPEYRISFLYAARRSLVNGRPDSAAALLLIAMTGRAARVESIVGAVVDSLVGHREYASAAILSQRYLNHMLSVGVPANVRKQPTARGIADRLPMLYLNAGDPARALQSAANFIRFDSRASSTVAEFTSDVASGNLAKWTARKVLFLPGVDGPQ